MNFWRTRELPLVKDDSTNWNSQTRWFGRCRRFAPSYLPDGLRFIGAGIANTGLTVAIYQLALFVFSAGVAYSIAWGIGFLLVATLYPQYVFKGGRRGFVITLLIAAVYAISFLIGLGTLYLIREIAGGSSLGNRLTIFFVLAVTTGFNFIAMRAVTRRSFLL